MEVCVRGPRSRTRLQNERLHVPYIVGAFRHRWNTCKSRACNGRNGSIVKVQCETCQKNNLKTVLSCNQCSKYFHFSC